MSNIKILILYMDIHFSVMYVEGGIRPCPLGHGFYKTLWNVKICREAASGPYHSIQTYRKRHKERTSNVIGQQSTLY